MGGGPDGLPAPEHAHVVAPEAGRCGPEALPPLKGAPLDADVPIGGPSLQGYETPSTCASSSGSSIGSPFRSQSTVVDDEGDTLVASTVRHGLPGWCCFAKSGGDQVAPCVFYGSGVVWLLVAHGLLQERIMSFPYDGEYFQASAFLVLCNRLVGIMFALSMICIRGEAAGNTAPLWKYLAISFTSVGGSICQYEALKYVSFPVQMVAKSFKMMPVMLCGIAISKKSYSWKDWAHAATVTAGVSQFLLTGDVQSKHLGADSTYGLMLLVGFLALDGFTSTFQEKLFKEHKTSTYNQMLYINLGSLTVALLSLLPADNMRRSVTFVAAHPALGQDCLLLSLAAAGSQWFIYSQVKAFGALVLAMTLNVRQVISIMLSYAAYGHRIMPLQVVGLVLVFSAIFFKNIAKTIKKHSLHPCAGMWQVCGSRCSRRGRVSQGVEAGGGPTKYAVVGPAPRPSGLHPAAAEEADPEEGLSPCANLPAEVVEVAPVAFVFGARLPSERTPP